MVESHHRTTALPAKSNSVAQTAVFVFFMTLFSLIMVWDMKKMHDMSEVIHDDHTSMWEKMNDTMIRSFWSPLDLCMLTNNDSKVDIRTYRTKVCNKYLTSNSVLSSSGAQKLFCNAGSSLGKACPAPLSTRTYFMYRLRDSRFRDPRSTYLSESMKYLAKNRMPIVFIGDGLSKQNEDALICDLLRTDSVSVTTNTASAKINEKGIIEADYTVQWRATPSLKLEVKYFKVSYVEEDERIRKQHRKNRKSSRRTEVINSTSPDKSKHLRNGYKRFISEDAALNMNATVVAANSRSILSFEQLKTALHRFITSQNRSMALVANIGVWYNSREKFREELPDFLKWLHDLKDKDPKNVIFYRETAAQHWNHTESGYYDKEYHETNGNNNGTCEPIADASPGKH